MLRLVAAPPDSEVQAQTFSQLSRVVQGQAVESVTVGQ